MPWRGMAGTAIGELVAADNALLSAGFAVVATHLQTNTYGHKSIVRGVIHR
jgi:hypothetical protein